MTRISRQAIVWTKNSVDSAGELTGKGSGYEAAGEGAVEEAAPATTADETGKTSGSPIAGRLCEYSHVPNTTARIPIKNIPVARNPIMSLSAVSSQGHRGLDLHHHLTYNRIPNPKEGFYLPALEAMALGTPVIVPDCIGNRSFCIDGATCVIAAFDAEAIAPSVRKLVGNEPLLAALSTQGRLVAARYTIEREREEYIAHLRRYLRLRDH